MKITKITAFFIGLSFSLSGFAFPYAMCCFSPKHMYQGSVWVVSNAKPTKRICKKYAADAYAAGNCASASHMIVFYK